MARLPLGLGTPLSSTYDSRLVIISIVLAGVAAYTALTLGERVTVAHGRTRILWLVGGATAMGAGIWSMHLQVAIAVMAPQSE